MIYRQIDGYDPQAIKEYVDGLRKTLKEQSSPLDITFELFDKEHWTINKGAWAIWVENTTEDLFSFRIEPSEKSKSFLSLDFTEPDSLSDMVFDINYWVELPLIVGSSNKDSLAPLSTILNYILEGHLGIATQRGNESGGAGLCVYQGDSCYRIYPLYPYVDKVNQKEITIDTLHFAVQPSSHLSEEKLYLGKIPDLQFAEADSYKTVRIDKHNSTIELGVAVSLPTLNREELYSGS